MTITPRPVAGSYSEALFDSIASSEGFVPRVYTDHRGIATLGVGYALIVGGGRDWRLRDGLDAELASIGVALSAEDGALLNQARDALVDGDAERAKQLIPTWSAGEDSAARNRFSFALTRDQGRALFDLVRPKYEAILADKLGQAMYGAFEESHEMLALFSLAYNSPALVGSGLVGALQAGRRADAWYEIRYRSNAKRHPGLQNRRDHESDEFGLYNAAPSADEARAVLAFLEDKRSSIAAYLEQVSDSEAAGRNEIDRLMTVAQATVNDASGSTAMA